VISICRSVFVILSLALSACQNQLEPLPGPPGNFTVTPGDGQVTLNWDALPGQIYTVYFQVGPTAGIDNYFNMVTRITPPYIIAGLADQTQYAFILNASNGGSVPGPPTPVVTATPVASGATGSSWTVGAPLTPASLRWVAYGAHDYVAVGDGGSVYIANDSNSSSGITPWNQGVGVAIASGINIPAVLYNGAAFVAMGADGSIMTTSDTVDWTSGMSINSGSVQMTSLAYGNNTYVAVGLGGAIYTHSGANLSDSWILQTSPTANDLYNVSYVNGMFIAVGKGGALLTSTDRGASWTPQNANTSSNLYQVAYGAGTYVAVGDSGTITSSPDGSSWALQDNSHSIVQSLYAVAFRAAPPEFVAVGAAGIVVSSPSGTAGTWAAASAGGSDLNSIVAATVFVAVGASGANVSGN
jgi:hypothetical protein